MFGRPVAGLLDLPQLDPDHRPGQLLAYGAASPWPGALAVCRSPALDGWALVAFVRSNVLVGELEAPLPAGRPWCWDAGNVIEVTMSRPDLTSATDLQVFEGANALTIESAPGRWEIVQFALAELVGPARYRLSRLLRGQRGTEDAIGDPAPAGARVVVLDRSLAPVPFSTADLGLPFNWRIGPLAAPVSSDKFVAFSLAASGRGLMPLSPVHLRARRLAGGDLEIRWMRRDRDPGADSWELAEVPLSDAPEAYDLEILDGNTVVRTVSAITAASWVYTAADQTADFGAPIEALSARVWQLGPLGRGLPLEASVGILEATS